MRNPYQTNGFIGFNEAEAKSPRKSDGLRGSPRHHGYASMKPRQSRPGNAAREDIVGVVLVASMKPRQSRPG
ncbi:MAG: hypothetical protein OXJ64_11990, partial [Boseongicola sp.]|nr:hypothetical protein [Boseongicola sp.]